MSCSIVGSFVVRSCESFDDGPLLPRSFDLL